MLPNLWPKLKVISILVLVVGLTTSVAVPRSMAASPAQAGPTTWTILVGGEGQVEQQEYGPAGAWQFMRFYPETITINVGDTIVWQLWRRGARNGHHRTTKQWAAETDPES
jgi:plastocyanin